MISPSKVYTWCTRTIFSAKWWKDHWWIPFVFLGFILLRLMGGSSPVVRLSKKINKIKEKERKDISKIKKEKIDKEEKIDRDVDDRLEEVNRETEKKIDELKEKIKEDNKKIKGDSEKINDALNDILED